MYTQCICPFLFLAQLGLSWALPCSWAWKAWEGGQPLKHCGFQRSLVSVYIYIYYTDINVNSLWMILGIVKAPKSKKSKTSFISLFGMMIASWHHHLAWKASMLQNGWEATSHLLPVKKWEWAKPWYAKGTATLWLLIQNFHDQSADVAGCHQRIRCTFFFKHANSCQFNFIWENHRKSVHAGIVRYRGWRLPGNSSQKVNRRRLKGAPCWIAHRAPQLGSTSCRAKIGFELSEKW